MCACVRLSEQQQQLLLHSIIVANGPVCEGNIHMNTPCQSPAERCVCLTHGRDTQKTLDGKKDKKKRQKNNNKLRFQPKVKKTQNFSCLGAFLRFPACSLILFDWPGYLMWTENRSQGPPLVGSLWG